MQGIAGQYWPAGAPAATANTDIPIQVDSQGRLLTVAAEPVGGGITWTKTAVTMSGASANLLAANTARKGFMVASTATNAAAAIDITGGTAVLSAGLPLAGGQTIFMTGTDCPLGIITQIGTNTQLLTVYEGT